MSLPNIFYGKSLLSTILQLCTVSLYAALFVTATRKSRDQVAPSDTRECQSKPSEKNCFCVNMYQTNSSRNFEITCYHSVSSLKITHGGIKIVHWIFECDSNSVISKGRFYLRMTIVNFGNQFYFIFWNVKYIW